jgi:hypothetical protein
MNRMRVVNRGKLSILREVWMSLSKKLLLFNLGPTKFKQDSRILGMKKLEAI